MDNATYRQWRKTKLNDRPDGPDGLCVNINGLTSPFDSQVSLIIEKCKRYNMAIYKCRDRSVDRSAIRTFAANFGLHRPDFHLCANDDGVSELTATTSGTRAAYVPYSNRALSWHTDGYYNPKPNRVRAVVLHCAANAETGGDNALLDPDIAYILLRDRDPRFITAFEHPECMTIPANTDAGGEIRPAVTGPVFSYGNDGSIHMRYSARKRNIRWRDDALTRSAREFLAAVLDDKDGPVFKYRLQPGEGLISNNVLHNRTAFRDGAGHHRLLYRARFFDRVRTR
jgi:alpha-ketoglutarate-dependent taurine dioxygenase